MRRNSFFEPQMQRSSCAYKINYSSQSRNRKIISQKNENRNYLLTILRFPFLLFPNKVCKRTYKKLDANLSDINSPKTHNFAKLKCCKSTNYGFSHHLKMQPQSHNRINNLGKLSKIVTQNRNSLDL